MILGAFTLFHVALALVGIGSGLVVAYELIASKWSTGWNKIFLIATITTSVTGFFFPVRHFLPSHAVGILSLIVLAIAAIALYRHQLSGGWRRTYVLTAIVALYLNCFVLVVQLFEKVPALKELAPTQSEPPFQLAQLAILVVFIAIAIRASMKFHVKPAGMVKASAAM